jgi:Ca2+-binding RTX toxin-like protein
MTKTLTIQEIFGTEDNDILVGTPASDLIKGKDGNDFIFDGMGNDGSFGNEGNDFFFDGAGNDIIRGGEGNDFVFGVAQNNGGDDFIDPGAGNDFVFGGAGADTFVLNRNSGVTLIGDFTPGEDRFALGGSLTRDDLNFAQLDNDSSLGGSTLISEVDTGELLAFVAFTPAEAVANAEFINAERPFLMSNSPTADGKNNEPIEVELPEAKSGKIVGTPNSDVLVGNHRVNLILAGGGDDFVNAGGGSDRVFGEDGNDLVNGDRGRDLLDGGAGADVLNGGRGRDTLLGETGNDILNGDRGSDILRGGSGSDVISGGGGNDIIFGGDGNDALFGDEGRDIFVFAANQGADIIFDFEIGKDAIALQANSSYGSISTEYHASGNYSTITDTQSGELITTLIGIDATNLSAADFTTV